MSRSCRCAGADSIFESFYSITFWDNVSPTLCFEQPGGNFSLWRAKNIFVTTWSLPRCVTHKAVQTISTKIGSLDSPAPSFWTMFEICCFYCRMTSLEDAMKLNSLMLCISFSFWGGKNILPVSLQWAVSYYIRLLILQLVYLPG